MQQSYLINTILKFAVIGAQTSIMQMKMDMFVCELKWLDLHVNIVW